MVKALELDFCELTFSQIRSHPAERLRLFEDGLEKKEGLINWIDDVDLIRRLVRIDMEQCERWAGWNPKKLLIKLDRRPSVIPKVSLKGLTYNDVQEQWRRIKVAVQCASQLAKTTIPDFVAHSLTGEASPEAADEWRNVLKADVYELAERVNDAAWYPGVPGVSLTSEADFFASDRHTLERYRTMLWGLMSEDRPEDVLKRLRKQGGTPDRSDLSVIHKLTTAAGFTTRSGLTFEDGHSSCALGAIIYFPVAVLWDLLRPVTYEGEEAEAIMKDKDPAAEDLAAMCLVSDPEIGCMFHMMDLPTLLLCADKEVNLVLQAIAARDESAGGAAGDHGAGTARDAGTSRADGPLPPQHFKWGDVTEKTEPKPWELLRLVWSQPDRRIKKDKALQKVWGAGGTQAGLDVAKSKITTLLTKCGCPMAMTVDKETDDIVIR